MRKRAQEGSQSEAWDWLKPDTSWEPESREQASRRFFQVWNGIQGRSMDQPRLRTVPQIRANVPLRCSVWRGRVRNFRGILADLILKQSEGLLASFERGFEEIYDDLVAMASGDTAAQQMVERLDYFLGKGAYSGESLRQRLQMTVEEAAGRIKERNIAEQRAAIDKFWNALQPWPSLQKKYLDRVVEDAWTDFEKRGGYDTGTSIAGGEMRTNRLLTFYLMKDPFPYITAVPIISPKEITESNTPETALEGKALKGAKKTTREFTVYAPGEGITVYVKNIPNPDYDFIRITPREVGTQQATVEKIREKVIDVQRQSMFGKAYLAANVLEDSPAFEGLPGISLLELGRESTYDIADHERDVTKLKNGGLFRIPEGGLPKEKEYYPKLLSEEKKQQKAGPKTEPSGEKFQFKSRASLFSHSLQEVFAQEVVMPDLWFDDEGNNYSSAEEIIEIYAKDAWDAFWPKAKDMLRSIIEQDLGEITPTPGQVVQMPAPVPEEVHEIQPVEDYYTLEQEEVPASEEQLPVAARHVIRLVRVAKLLDAKGFYKEADKVDDITRDIIAQLTQ
jgi:hypothetical protein